MDQNRADKGQPIRTGHSSKPKAPYQTHEVQVGMLKRFQIEGTEVTVRLMGGGELTGKIRKYDTFVIEFRTSDGKCHLLYKHGIVSFSTAQALPDEAAA